VVDVVHDRVDVDSGDEGAEDTADDVNSIMNDIDHGLGH
jgi:hypothetical protein